MTLPLRIPVRFLFDIVRLTLDFHSAPADGDSLDDNSFLVETVLDPSCANPVSGGLTSAEATVVGTTTTAVVSIDFGTLGTDTLSDVDLVTKQLQFCYKLEIMYEGQQMNYVEAVITTSISVSSS